jgi:phosphate starvation-inducible PhoH-like protein
MGSKIVVAGDITQIDLPANQQSGLVDASWRLRHIIGFSQIELTEKDIVRHRLVQDIVRAYEDKPSGTRNSNKGKRR